MKTQEIRYDELRAGDIILFSGAKVIVEETVDEGESTYYPGESVIRFTIRPYDDEAIVMLGHFYAHGTYGGVGFLPAQLIERPVIGAERA